MTDSPLSQLNKEEQEALAELAKGRVNGNISRRDALQAAGVLGIGSLIGGGAGIAATDSAKAAPQGNVGTSSDPIANGYFDSLDADEGVINNPSISTTNFLESPLRIKGAAANGGGHGISLVPYDDGTYNSNSDKAPVRWYDSTGSFLFQILAHEKDDEMSFYGRDANGNMVKKIDIENGDPTTAVMTLENTRDFSMVHAGGDAKSVTRTDTNYSYIQTQSDQEDSELRLAAPPNGANGNDTAGIWRFIRDHSRDGELRLKSHGEGQDYVNLLGGTIDWLGNQMIGLREISTPSTSDLASREWAWDATNGRWLFKDSGGTVHFFTPDGTL